MELDGWLTLRQAAWHIGIRDTSSLRHAIKNGRLVATEVDGRYLVRVEEIERYRKERPANVESRLRKTREEIEP